MLDTEPFRAAPGSVVNPCESFTRDDGGSGKKAARELSKRLIDLQELLNVRRARGLLASKR